MKAWDVFVGFLLSALVVLLLSLSVDLLTKNPNVAKDLLISGLAFAVLILILMICKGLQVLVLWGIRYYLDTGEVPEAIGLKPQVDKLDIFADGFKPKIRERKKLI